MSAWAQLVNQDGSDEHLSLCNAALIEVQDQYARRLAQAIRSENPDRSDGWSDGAEWAADLIDPDVEM